VKHQTNERFILFQFEIREFEKKNWEENLHLKFDLHGVCYQPIGFVDIDEKINDL